MASANAYGGLMEIKTIIGWFIYSYCQERNWSVARFAMLTGIHQRTIYNWIHGRYLPHELQLRKVARFVTRYDASNYEPMLEHLRAVVRDDQALNKSYP